MTFKNIASVEIIPFCKDNAENNLMKILAGSYMKFKYKNTALLRIPIKHSC